MAEAGKPHPVEDEHEHRGLLCHRGHHLAEHVLDQDRPIDGLRRLVPRRKVLGERTVLLLAHIADALAHRVQHRRDQSVLVSAYQEGPGPVHEAPLSDVALYRLSYRARTAPPAAFNEPDEPDGHP